MKTPTSRLLLLLLLLTGIGQVAWGDDAKVLFSGSKKQNNLVSTLLEVAAPSKSEQSFSFVCPREGWIFISATCRGTNRVKVLVDAPSEKNAPAEIEPHAGIAEAVRYVSAGEHHVRVTSTGNGKVERLVVKAISELMHSGLGYDPAIKSYGKYDVAFLKKDILPNVTTVIIPSNLKLDPAFVDDWHRQGKRLIAEVGVNPEAKTADEHYRYWTGSWEKSPSLDGIIIDEFIVNQPIREWMPHVSPERQRRFDAERAQYPLYEEAFRRIHANPRYRDKTVFAYIGGSGKRLNQEIIGPTFVRTLINCDDRIALERYVFERSSPEKSKQALDEFVDGISDWEAKEPGVKRNMVIAFGLFSMPPGGINKLPNVDYHVWMDQQMNLVANHPALADIGGINWWTSLLADEETVRFVGKLYRHYAIEGNTNLLTHDPLFLDHLENADFAKGTEGWTLQPAEPGSITAKSFPRYGRIEGRYMGLGRPADPEHIGDTVLCMKRSAKGPNRFSQTVKHLEPGRLYSLKMFSCDYADLVHPKQKSQDEATKFVGGIELDGVAVDSKRSFAEMYPSGPEPRIPVWITYHWIVFRAKGTTAQLTVSDWSDDKRPTGPVGLEQTFNFLELQPYHE